MSDVLNRAKSLESDLIRFLRELVAIPSACGKESTVIKRIKQEMEWIGFDEVRVDELGNLLGRIGQGSRVLAIDGHCDVVDVGNPDLWDVDPFAAVLRDGILYGRGSCDQKGGLACAIHSVKLLKEIGFPEDVTLWVVASIMEEDCEGLAWKYIVEEDQLRPEAVLITEPTNLNLYRGHRGRLEIKVKTEGISCHGSAPERGVNAIYKMSPIIQDVAKLQPRLKDNPFLGKGSITITDIRSTSPSLCAVADFCTIHLDRRLTAGETIDSSLEEIHSLPSFQKAEAKAWVPEYRVPSYTGKLYPMQSYFPTWVLNEEHPVLKTAVQSYRNLFGTSPEVGKWSFSTNGVGIMGLYQIPTVGFGPGNEIYAHAPNEQVPVDHLSKALAFYVEFVRNF